MALSITYYLLPIVYYQTDIDAQSTILLLHMFGIFAILGRIRSDFAVPDAIVFFEFRHFL